MNWLHQLRSEMLYVLKQYSGIPNDKSHKICDISFSDIGSRQEMLISEEVRYILQIQNGMFPR